jgi:inosine-uridine nucleoside N-ribohydrolase
MARNVIIDCDTGMDDAVALLLALRSQEFNVLGITCVNGNVGLDHVVNNTLRVVEHSGKDVPVYAGSRNTLMVFGEEDAAAVHGKDGLGGLPFPQPKIKVQDEHAVDFIVRTFMEVAEPMEWITLGPLTNAAMAIRREPRIVEKISRLTMMAGGVESGNTSVMSEFNIYFDPEAARIVFDSDIPKMMVPLDPLWNGGHLTVDNLEQIKKAGDDRPWCVMASQIFAKTLETMIELGRMDESDRPYVSPPDLLAVAVAINASIAEIKDYPVFIEMTGEYTRGMTVIDRRRFTHLDVDTSRSKVAVAMTIDQKKYADLIMNTWLKG